VDDDQQSPVAKIVVKTPSVNDCSAVADNKVATDDSRNRLTVANSHLRLSLTSIECTQHTPSPGNIPCWSHPTGNRLHGRATAHRLAQTLPGQRPSWQSINQSTQTTCADSFLRTHTFKNDRHPRPVNLTSIESMEYEDEEGRVACRNQRRNGKLTRSRALSR